jgi:hypothetical protein
VSHAGCLPFEFSGFSKNRTAEVLIFIAILFLVRVTLEAQPILTWTPNSERDLGGYKVHMIDAGRVYPVIDLKLQNWHSLTNLDAETTYWIYVTAYDTNGNQSLPSKVLQYPLGGGCNFVVQPNSGLMRHFPSTGHFRIFTGSGCSWQAVPSDEWITVPTNLVAGAGLVEFTYMVAGNTNPAPRRGSILVQDQIFTVFQAGFVPLSVTNHLPANVAVVEGQRLQLELKATDEAPEVLFQWYLEDQPIEGATNRVFSIESVLPEDEGSYSVTVLTPFQTIIEGPVEVSVYKKPRIPTEGQPLSTAVAPGESAVLFVGATGSELHYEWSMDGSRVGIDSPWLYLPSVGPFNFGAYEVRVYNAAGSVLSRSASLFPGSPKQSEGRINIVSTDPEAVVVEANGLPGDLYEIQLSVDLVEWFTIETVRPDLTGRFAISVPTPETVDKWFVRTVRQRPSSPFP